MAYFSGTCGNVTYLLGEKGIERLTLQHWAVGRYYKKSKIIFSISVWERLIYWYSYVAKHLELQLLAWEKVG